MSWRSFQAKETAGAKVLRNQELRISMAWGIFESWSRGICDIQGIVGYAEYIGYWLSFGYQ